MTYFRFSVLVTLILNACNIYSKHARLYFVHHLKTFKYEIWRYKLLFGHWERISSNACSCKEALNSRSWDARNNDWFATEPRVGCNWKEPATSVCLSVCLAARQESGASGLSFQFRFAFSDVWCTKCGRYIMDKVFVICQWSETIISLWLRRAEKLIVGGDVLKCGDGSKKLMSRQKKKIIRRPRHKTVK